MHVTDAMVLRLQRILNCRLKEVGSGRWVGEPMARGILEEVVEMESEMKRREVTDEMVERAWKSFHEHAHNRSGSDRMKFALSAALNPPEEPEIVVMRDMAEAGAAVLKEYKDRGYRFDDVATFVYRAMRKLEPSPLSPFLGGPTPHRRKDDPR